MYLWQKLLLRNLVSSTLAVLLFSFFLFALIDISSHSSFQHYSIIDQMWLQAAQLSHRLDVLLPFSCLIASIRVAVKMNESNEFLALFTAGVRAGQVIAAFAFFGIFATAFIYANNQFILPNLLPKANLIREGKQLEKITKQGLHRIKGVLLEDDSVLVYQYYARNTKSLEDVYWLKMNHDIVRMRKLLLASAPPAAIEADLFSINSDGSLTYKESVSSMPLPELKFRSKNLLESFLVPEELSYTELYDKANNFRFEESEKLAAIKSSFYKKLLNPWLTLIATLFPLPFCISFERKQSAFSLYLFATCALACSYLILQAFFTLSKKQLLSAEWALPAPFLVVVTLSLCGYFYKKILSSFRNLCQSNMYDTNNGSTKNLPCNTDK